MLLTLQIPDSWYSKILDPYNPGSLGIQELFRKASKPRLSVRGDDAFDVANPGFPPNLPCHSGRWIYSEAAEIMSSIPKIHPHTRHPWKLSKRVVTRFYANLFRSFIPMDLCWLNETIHQPQGGGSHQIHHFYLISPGIRVMALSLYCNLQCTILQPYYSSICRARP